MKTIKVTNGYEIPKNYTGIVEWSNGSKIWYKEGQLHREDGPAVEYSDGGCWWYLEDQEYFQISLKNYVILDHDKGEYGIMWYKLLDKNKILDIPNIPGLIMDFTIVDTSPSYFTLHSKYKTKINADQGPFINDKKYHNIRKNKCMV